MRRAVLAVALLVAVVPAPSGAQEELDCPNLANRDDARAVLAADPDDPFGLDDGPGGPNGVPCETDADLDSGPRATCELFDLEPNGDDIAQALYNSNPDAYPGLLGCVEPLDAPTPAPAAPVVPPASDGTGPRPSATRGPSVSYRDAVPEAVLARIDDCAAVAVSRRRVVATGCADGGTVRFRQPAGEPDLRRTAVARFVLPELFGR